MKLKPANRRTAKHRRLLEWLALAWFQIDQELAIAFGPKQRRFRDTADYVTEIRRGVL